MTALLESIKLFMAALNAHDKLTKIIDPDQAHKYVRVKFNLTWTKKDSNDPTQLQCQCSVRIMYWNTCAQYALYVCILLILTSSHY